MPLQSYRFIKTTTSIFGIVYAKSSCFVNDKMILPFKSVMKIPVKIKDLQICDDKILLHISHPRAGWLNILSSISVFYCAKNRFGQITSSRLFDFDCLPTFTTQCLLAGYYEIAAKKITTTTYNNN